MEAPSCKAVMDGAHLFLQLCRGIGSGMDLPQNGLYRFGVLRIAFWADISEFPGGGVMFAGEIKMKPLFFRLRSPREVVLKRGDEQGMSTLHIFEREFK